jgi:nucleoid DNA-binding protein
MAHQTHPLVSHLAPMMNREIEHLHRVVAEWVLDSATERERSALRSFGAELGAVQRRIRLRPSPPTEEEIEIALTAVLALSHRRINIGRPS